MKNHSDELIFHSQGLRRSAANLVRSHRRIRLREILLACLSAKRFDMEERVKNHSDELIFHSRGLCRSVTNLDDRIGESDIRLAFRR